MQHPSQRSRPATQINHAPARRRLHQVQQVIERLLALRLEARILVRLPSIAASTGHDREPINSTPVP